MESVNGTHCSCACRGLSSYALALVGEGEGGVLKEVEGEEQGRGGMSKVVQALLAVGLGLLVVALMLLAALCYVCFRAKVGKAKRRYYFHAKFTISPISPQRTQHKPLKDISVAANLCLPFCGGASSREGTNSPDFSFQGHVVHQDSPTFNRSYQDMVNAQPILVSLGARSRWRQ